GELNMQNVTLKTAIAAAYAVNERDVYGQDPVDADRFDIAVHGAHDAPNATLMRMLRTVLEDRFKLRVHEEQPERPGCALAAAPGGLKLRELDFPGGPRTNTTYGRIVAESASLARIADVLSHLFDIPVVDDTGLKGRYNLTIEWSASERLTGDSDAPTLF